MGSDFGAVTPNDLMDYVDGAASPDVRERIENDPRWAAEARALAATQRALHQRLYRFDCPPSQTLGEYELGLLPADERTRIAQHIVTCPRCTEELAVLRAFMADEPDAPPVGIAGQVRRLVAALLPPPLAAPSGLRGAGDETARTYRAADVTITLDVASMGRGRFALTGLIWRDEDDTGTGDRGDALAVGTATLTGTDGATQVAEIDDLGNVTFDDLAAGTYQLEISLGDDSVTIADIRIEN